jgi:ABC-type amino acid transport substrate-binding protein
VNDNLFRFAAVALAAALLAAPYWAQIQALAYRAMEAGKAKAGLVGRIVAAGLLIAAAWGKVPLPTLPSVAPQVSVATPSDEMQRLVTPVADALAGLPAADRNLWASLWLKVLSRATP